jgi:hypothetical protein
LDAKELTKIFVLLFLNFCFAPALGLFIKGRQPWQRVVFFAMCFMTISGLLRPEEWGLTLGFVDNYRGHTRGFHFFFNEAFAIALIVARYLESPRRFRWVAPGMIVYLLYVAASLIPVINAPVNLYVWMAALKFIKVLVIFVAAYNFFQNTEDVQFFLNTMVITMLWELLACLNLKYFKHQYQICGTFEHQNALAMYVSLVAMVFLSAGAGPRQPRSTFYLIGFVACAWIVECTLSRGGLVAFSIGTGGVILFSLLDKITPRRVLVVTAIGLVACGGALFALNTIVGRFNDSFNADSAQTRVMLNEASRQMLRDYPVGIGWNNYGVAINPPFPYGDHIDDYFRKHGDATQRDTRKGIVESHYYLLLAETGYQGFAAYILLIAVFLFWNARAALYFRHHFLGAVSLGIAVGCGVNYLQSSLERVLTQPRNMMLWMLLLALTARIEAWRREAVRLRSARARAARAETAKDQPAEPQLA